jgi:hypothetical protein
MPVWLGRALHRPAYLPVYNHMRHMNALQTPRTCSSQSALHVCILDEAPRTGFFLH